MFYIHIICCISLVCSANGFLLPLNPTASEHSRSNISLSSVDKSKWPRYAKAGTDLHIELIQFERPADPSLTKDILEAFAGIKYQLSMGPQGAYFEGPLTHGWVVVYFYWHDAITRKQASQVLQVLYVLTRANGGQEIASGRVSLGGDRRTAVQIDEFFVQFF